jgi:solute carrier family 25 folate transporter 32
VSADGLKETYRSEGFRGLWKGSSLALFGVSNGAIQFMAYEKMKDYAFARKRSAYTMSGKTWTAEDDKLVGHVWCLACHCVSDHITE